MKALAALFAFALAAVPASLLAADAKAAYPTKPVRLIIPFPPGGTTDIMGRLTAQGLSETWSQQVIVDNRGGAAGQIGAELAATSPPDGYTLFMGHIGTLGVNPALYAKLRYDPLKDFVPVSLVSRVHNLLVVHPSLPVKRVSDLVKLARSKPGALNYGSAGAGSVPFLCMEYFKMLTKTDIVHVPYKGSGPMSVDLLAGQVSLTFTGIPSLLPHVRAGRLRPVAVGSEKRVALLPDVPTVAESGVQGFEVVQWYGVVAPSGTPPAIVTRINADLVQFLRRTETAEKMAAAGAEAAPTTSADFESLIRSEMERWAEVIKATGAKPL
jgi:tripartite-type tricarboxylate transporter receptor subunit TctC